MGFHKKLCSEQLRVPAITTWHRDFDPSKSSLADLDHTVRYCGLDEGHDDDHMTIYNGQPVRWR